MVAKSAQYFVCFSLAGSFAVAIAPSVLAQVQVTGGNVSGQAAFFVPTPGNTGATSAGKVELFDLGINRLRLETSAGNTSTALFVPTAASFNAGTDNRPNAGDTGTLKGNLSGIAFSGLGGTPVPFSNRQTVLNFNLTSFNSNLGTIDGTLLSPRTAGDAALVFLPKVEATVSNGSSFQATRGDLELGDFRADLKTGIIDLPSSLVLRDSAAGGANLPPVALTQRLKFSFEGENVRPGDGTDFTVGSNNTGSIRFVGQANKKFQIQTIGNSSSTEFKIDGNLAAVDIKLSGPFDIKKDDQLSRTQIVDKFKIEGESEGVGSLFALNSLNFTGTSRRDTKFSFEQGRDKLEGSSNGDVNFYVVAGATQFNRDTAFTNANSSTFNGGSSSSSNRSSSSSVPSMCTICGNTLVNNSTIVVGRTNVVVGSPIIINTSSSASGGSVSGGGSASGSGSVSGGGSASGSGSTSGGGSTSGSGSVSGGGTTTTGSANTVNVDVFGLAQVFTSSTARVQYQILTSSNIISFTNINNSSSTNNVSNTNIRTNVRLVQRGGERYYIVTRDSGSGSTTNNRGDDDNRGNNGNNRGDDDNRGNNANNRGDDNRGNSANNRGDDDNSTSSDQTAYQLVGPSSRCFPGLVGLKQIPASEVANISNENPGNTSTSASVNNNTNNNTSAPGGVSQ